MKPYVELIGTLQNHGFWLVQVYIHRWVYRWLSKLWSPFGILSLIRQLVFRGPKWDHNFDNHPYTYSDRYIRLSIYTEYIYTLS